MMKVEKRRRMEGKTDYRTRQSLLGSEKPRIVFRKTAKYVIGQYVKSKEAKDEVIVGVESKHLLNYGWPEELAGSLKSLPACYLTGLLLGKRILAKDKNAEAILDLGLLRNIPKSRMYGFLKGVIDAGVKLKCAEEMFPDKDRITGKHLKNDIPKIFSKIQKSVEEGFSAGPKLKKEKSSTTKKSEAKK
jgi:large subunit ribosomal protein L18